MAGAVVFLMENYSSDQIINLGVGDDISIKELAELVKSQVEFLGDLVFDSSKPDGTPRKLMDVSLLNSFGWKAKTSLEQGIAQTYQWYVGQV
jgi:GDP-L-fucose synthase